MEIKQQALEQPVEQRRSEKGDKKTPWNKQNGNTTYQNLWLAAETVRNKMFTVIKAYTKKNRKISNPAFY